jgi:hypothetical protein
MKLYEFITPSDPITFYAADDDIAQVVGIYVGNGQAGVSPCAGDKNRKIETMHFFGPLPNDIMQKMEKVAKERLDDFLEAAHSFAVCNPDQRVIYDEYTNNGKDKSKVEKWDDKNRSSMNDWCKYARSLKAKIKIKE